MPSTAPELAVCLTDDHWRSRKDALEQFMRLDEDAGKLVFNRLRATLSGAHTLAGMCLPEVWGKKPANFAAQAVSELTFHLADADPLVRKAAQEPLEELQKKAIVGDVVVAGQAALPSLKERLLDEDWQIRDATLRAMARLGVGALSCSKDIARLLTDDSAVCRDSAKSALDTMLGAGLAAADLKVVVPPNAELYVQRLKHQDPKVRCAACWVLGHSAAAVVNLHGIAEVLVKESNPKTLSLAAECIGAMQLAALPAAPEVAESLKSFMAQEGREKMRGIARSPAGAALMQLHKEVVAVIGRAITKDPRVKDAAERAQQYGARLGRETNLQREEGVKALMQPAHSHVAAVTELLRVILDPECPGAQAGMPSYLIAVGSLETFRENGLLGGFDLSRCDIIAEHLEALEDSSWTVRLASAEALATLSCHIRPFLQCLRQHRKSDNNELKVAAQKLWQSIDAGKVWTHARVMSESAVKVMRGMINTTKSGVPSRTTLGCVQIPSDVTLEDEGPPFGEQMGIDIQMTKVSFDSEDICAGTYLRAMQREELTKGAKTLAALAVSSGQKCDVLGLSCTSFSFTLGSAKVREQISAVTDMAQAQLEALKALQAKQVALLTPYIEELSQANAEMLESMGGFRVVSRLTMNLPTDDLTSAVPPAEIADWAVRTDSPQADVVVIGCSGFRACQPDFLDALEQRLGKPVVTSTQASLWHMACSAGVQKKIKGYGTLLSSH